MVKFDWKLGPGDDAVKSLRDVVRNLKNQLEEKDNIIRDKNANSQIYGVNIDWFRQFWEKQAAWSQKTFGSDGERGPAGPIDHLLKEVQEVFNAARTFVNDDKTDLLVELIDCQHLLFDAARRAGFSYDDYIKMLFTKLDKNMARTWQTPTSDKAVEHDRRYDADADGDQGFTPVLTLNSNTKVPSGY